MADQPNADERAEQLRKALEDADNRRAEQTIEAARRVVYDRNARGADGPKA